MILLLGNDSILAKQIIPHFKDKFKICSIRTTDNNLKDDTFFKSVIYDNNPEAVINCIEYNHIDSAELWRGDAYFLNGFIVRKIADICKELDIFLIHFSSSYIFSGNQKTPYIEDDTPGPISVFGDSKLFGEKQIIDSQCRNLTIRLPDVYGIDSSFMQDIFKRIRNFGNINVIRERYISPVSTLDIAEALLLLIEKNAEGFYHFGPAGYTTAAAFTRETVRLFNELQNNSLNFSITEKDAEEYSIVADRPAFNVLDNSKYASDFKMEVSDWKTSLKNFIETYGDRI